MNMPTCITRPFGALARIGALALACLLVMIAIAGCSGVGSNGVENVFDEIVLTSPTSANESIFGSVEAQTPTGFEQLAPSGTDPHAGEVVVYEYVGSDLGDPWEESGLGSVDDAGEDPREASLDATVRSESSKLDIVCWTPSRVAADGKEYYAGVELTYAVGDDGPALAEYYEQRGTDGNYSLLDRDEWLTATGMDGDALDSWAQHAIRDLYVAGYLDANVETTLFSMDDLGNGVSLEGDFLARMRES